MALTLTDHDKEIIRLVDDQVKLLTEKKASEHTIISTLMDFVPEVRCIAAATCEKQFNMYCQEYQSFNYFLHLINEIA